jgi:hypothetical protein
MDGGWQGHTGAAEGRNMQDVGAHATESIQAGSMTTLLWLQT